MELAGPLGTPLGLAQRQRIDAFELWCWRRLLRVPWTARRSNQSILKEINPRISFLVRPASSLGAPERSGTPSRHSRGIDTPVAITRGCRGTFGGRRKAVRDRLALHILGSEHHAKRSQTVWVQFPALRCPSSVVSDSLRPHGLQPAKLLCPWGPSRHQPSPWVGPGKPNLPLGLRGKAGGGARVTAG